MSAATHYPFSAVVGMDDLGLALCLSAVSPGIGGVLVRGEKGTAKSTMVRALAAVLPPVQVVDGCRFACDPERPDPDCPDGPHAVDGAAGRTRPVRLIELPVGASEDRVIGSLHLDRLVSQGKVDFEPGLLAHAHRGLLYVDEVNLLPDHLVDTLLDAAAMGRARVEREGVSVSHAAAFVLVGTMNPEEGDLRPQLLDRFGLAVDVRADRDPVGRAEVIRRRLAYEADPAGFATGYEGADSVVAQRIAVASDLLPKVRLDDDHLQSIAALCAAYDIDGLRGDLVLARTAVAHAAWAGRDSVDAHDIRVAARLALPHRRRRNPFDTGESGPDLEQLLDEHIGEEGPDPDHDPTDPGGGPDGPDGGPDGPGGGPDGQGPERSPRDEVQDESAPQPDLAQEPPKPTKTPEPQQDSPPRGQSHGTQGENPDAAYAARLLSLRRTGRGVAGRRSQAVTSVGRHVRAVPLHDPRGQGLSATGTVHAAARRRGGEGPPQAGTRHTGLRIAGEDLRRSLRVGREGNLVVFAVDTSGSMGAARRVREVKAAVVSLLLDAYQRRDKVAVVTFRGREAQVVLPPTSSVERAERLLAQVPTGGRTPLAEGIAAVHRLVQQEQARDARRRPLVLLLTDGRASHGPDPLRRALHAARAARLQDGEWLVIDAEKPGPVRLGLAAAVAEALDAPALPLVGLGATGLAAVARAGLREGEVA